MKASRASTPRGPRVLKEEEGTPRASTEGAVLTDCWSCGKSYTADSNFCRECGVPRIRPSDDALPDVSSEVPLAEAALRELSSAAAAAQEPKPTEKPSFWVIYLTVFLDFFANGIVLPVLQMHARGLGASGFNVGMVFTAYSAAQIPGSFIFGRMSDFVGRRPVIIASLIMSTVTLVLTLLAPSYGSLIVARAIAGFFSETSVCQAYLADKTTSANRAAAFGHMGAFIGLAFILGPASGALLGIYGGFDLAVKFTVVITAINFIIACIWLDESLSSTPAPSDGTGWRIYLRTLCSPLILLVLIGQFSLTLAFMGWNTTFALWASSRLGYAQKDTGWAFSWLAVGFFLASWKTRTYTKDPSNSFIGGIIGCGLMCLGLLAHWFVDSTLQLLPPLFGIGFGYAMSEIVFQALISVHSPKALQGSLLGSLSASQALARAAAPAVTGYLFDRAPTGQSGFAYAVISAAPALGALITAAASYFMPAAGSKKQE